MEEFFRKEVEGRKQEEDKRNQEDWLIKSRRMDDEMEISILKDLGKYMKLDE